MILCDFLIDQYERKTKWNNITEGNASFRIEEKYYKYLDKTSFLNQAKELESKKLLKIKWVSGYYNEDIEKLKYPLTSMKDFYRIANRKPKYEEIMEKKQEIIDLLQKVKTSWIREYLEKEVLKNLIDEKYLKKYKVNEAKDKKNTLLYQCLLGLDQLDSPIFKRVFSKRYLKNSKLFEKQLQSVVLRIARKYHDGVEEGMENSDVLFQLYIEEYSQELHIKGSLLIKADGITLDTGEYHYGTVLNSLTLKNAVILKNQKINKILTIENKANYMAEPYEAGTLVIFTHGYFTPLERDFLCCLKESLEDKPVTYLHSGDLDYGGVRIFQYIKSRIFPDLKPYKMDIETYNRYISCGEAIEERTLKKLKKCREPILQDVIDRIIETGLVIEQEAYL
ncbi:DUF2399 domain-containing protein [Anaerocolumna sedimenticola]|uniref:DUF2399 domain-containing protein n=1 Tax=Anaerocolumna sedimenticola TaxID=2696063 RepID=A0A6P1TME6_9FIRM|nr:Wadjet anti-phage system protein JetD domain-containing protein [Anaerocolumna sedimenticola]QHQ61111.1 DUF2399 domain-containing protein [Anaerocolumna sedimenticola]